MGRRIRVVHAGVADVEGNGQLLLPMDGALGVLEFHHGDALSRLRANPDGHELFNFSVASLPVRVTTVDAQVAGRPVCFLKTDVEGSDLLVMHGAKRALDSARLVSFETNEKALA